MIAVNSREDFLIEVSKIINSNYVVEIGVYEGDFSKMILDILKPKRFFLIDPYKQNEVYYKGCDFTTAYSTEGDYDNLVLRFKNEIESLQVIVDKKFSYDAVPYYPNESIDMIYLDGSHLYEDVKRDLNDWLPKLKHNGIIAGHDMIDHESFGVIKAVEEFLKEHNDFGMILFNTNGNDWAIKKINK